MRRVALLILPLGLTASFWLAERSVPPRRAGPPAKPSSTRPPPIKKPLGKETLSGRVVGLHGEGLVGLTVTVIPDAGEESVADTLTHVGGAFALAGLAPGVYRLRVAGPGVIPAELRPVAVPASQVAVVASRAVGVAGRVTDGGLPAPGAAIEVSGSTMDASRETIAGPDGRFRLEGLPEGQLAVAARRGTRAAVAPAVARFGAGPWPDVDLVLGTAAEVTVAVADEGGAPVAGAHVVLGRDDLVRRSTTDAAGRARFPGVAPGAWDLDVVAEGFVFPAQRDLTVEAGATLVIDASLQRGAVVTGRVVDAAGSPVAAALVELRGDGQVISAYGRAQRLAWAAGRRAAAAQRLIPKGELGVLPGPIPLPPPPGAAVPAALGADVAEPSGFRTGAGGGFRIDGVPAGRWVARASHPDFAPGESEPFSPGAAPTIVLRRGGDVSGRVTDDRGVPLLGAEMSLLQDGRTVSVTFVDGEGRYRFAHVLGEATVRAAARGHAAVDKTVAPGEGESVELPLALPPATGSVSGRVVDPEGRPVAGAEIVATGPADVKIRGRTDADGRFALAGLSGGAWRLSAVHPDFPPAETTLTDGPVELVLRGGGGVRGEVRDAVTRGPVLAFTITGDGPGGAALRRSFEKGSFELAPLAAGPWKLTVEARGFATRVFHLQVPPGARPRGITLDGVWLELQVGATVAGIVYDEHGEAVPGATVTCGVVSTTTDRLGAFKLRGVDVGDVPVVAAHAAAGAARVVVPLRSGDEFLTLEIRLAR